MRYTLLALLAACGSSSPAPTVSNSGSGTAAPPASVDCGAVSPSTSEPDARAAYACLTDAFDAHTPATLRTEAITDEGGHIFTTFTVGADLEVVTDDRDDGFAAAPGVHVSHCAGVHLEPTATSAVIFPDDCRSAAP